MLNALGQIKTRKRGAWEITTDTLRNVRSLLSRRHPAETPPAAPQSPLNSLPPEIGLDIIALLPKKDRQSLLFTNRKYAALVLHQKYHERLKTILTETLSPRVLNTGGGLYEQSQKLFSLQQVEIDHFLMNANQILEKLSLRDCRHDSYLLTILLTSMSSGMLIDYYVGKPNELTFSNIIGAVNAMGAVNAIGAAAAIAASIGLSEQALVKYFLERQFRPLYETLKTYFEQLKTLPNDACPQALVARHKLLDQINKIIVLIKIAPISLRPTKVDVADFTNCHLTRFPAILFSDVKFERYMSSCKKLLLGSNNLSWLPKTLEKYDQLNFLGLADNCFSEFPNVATCLPLAKVNLYRNYLKEIAEDIPDEVLVDSDGLAVTKEEVLQHQYQEPDTTIKVKPN